MRALFTATLVALVAAVAACPEAPPREVTMDSHVLVDKLGVTTPLVCPGAKHCEKAGGALRAAAAKRAITPDVEAAPVYLAGFSMGRQATDVHDDVWSRMIVVEQGDVRVGVVSLDCVGFFHNDAVRVRQAAQEAGLELDDVIIASTHVHESKDTMGIWGPDPGHTGYDEAYQQMIIAQTVDGLKEAVDNLADAKVQVGLAHDDTMVRDSRLPLVVDDAVHTLHFTRTDDGAPLGTLVIFGNHPEALGSDNTSLTSDYPHYVREEIEAELPGTTAVFMNAILGGLTTPIGRIVCPNVDDATIDDCPQGTFERAERLGRHMAQAAVASLSAPDAYTMDAPPLAFRRQPVMLTPTSTGLGLAFKVGLVNRPVFSVDTGAPMSKAELSLVSIDDIKLGVMQIDSEVSALSLGDVEIVTVPGELYAELWVVGADGDALIERPENADFPDAPFETPIQKSMRDAKTKIILNQANDAIGYIIPWAQFDEEAPYAYDPDGQYGESVSLGAHSAPDVCGAVEELYRLSVN